MRKRIGVELLPNQKQVQVIVANSFWVFYYVAPCNFIPSAGKAESVPLLSLQTENISFYNDYVRGITPCNDGKVIIKVVTGFIRTVFHRGGQVVFGEAHV